MESAVITNGSVWVCRIIILFVPAIITLLLRPFISGLLDKSLAAARERAATDYVQYRKMLAFEYAPYRAAAYLITWAFTLAATAALGAWQTGQLSQIAENQEIDRELLWVLFTFSAIGPLVLGAFMLAGGVRFGDMIRGTGLAAVAWLAVGAFSLALLLDGFGVESMLLPNGMGLGALILLLIPRPGGSTLQRMKRARMLSRDQFAEAALPKVLASGRYDAPGTTGIMGKIQGTVFVPATVLTYVAWDEEGIEVGWLEGDPNKYRWHEIERLEIYEGKHSEGASAFTTDGRKLDLSDGGQGYKDLLAVFQARVWSRFEPEE